MEPSKEAKGQGKICPLHVKWPVKKAFRYLSIFKPSMSRPTNKNRIRKQPKGRDHQRPCFIEGCHAKVVNLRRHLVNVQRKILVEAKLMIDVRKKQPNRKYSKKKFPVDDCSFIGTRIDRHLERVDNESHQQALLLARTTKREIPRPEVKNQVKTPQVSAADFLRHHTSLEGDFVDKIWNLQKKNKKTKQNNKLASQIRKLLEIILGEDASFVWHLQLYVHHSLLLFAFAAICTS